jgi:hypothetical protein
MLNQELLEQAIEKYYNKNEVSDRHYKNDTMEDFILRIHNQCDPSTYGKKFVNKILKDHGSYERNEMKLYTVFDKSDKGDMAICYPEADYFSGRYYDPRTRYYRPLDYKTEVIKKWFEVKISYLGKNNDIFTIRNVRPYQDFDYFLLCFVDCKDNFKPTFIMLKKGVITDNPFNITLTAMNGTKNANKDNKDIGYGTTIKKNSWRQSYLLSKNLLGGTSYSDVTEFLNKEFDKVKIEFNEKVPLNQEQLDEIEKYKCA